MRTIIKWKSILSLAFVLTFTLSHPHHASAFNTEDDAVGKWYAAPTDKGGHEKITDYAIDNLSYASALKSKLDSAHSTLREAVAAEDLNGRPVTHFYNPQTRRGLYGFLPSAKFMASEYYGAAVSNYLTGYRDSAWSYLGHALHLVQDMSSPSHVQGVAHYVQATSGTGFEWWVSKNWGTVQGSMDRVFTANPSWRTPSIAGTIDGLMDAVAERTYADNYVYDAGDGPIYPDGAHFTSTVSPADAAYNAFFLVPQAVRTSGTLFRMFCMDVNCTGSTTIPFSSGPPPGNDHPDDTFDVSSRMVRLENLSPERELWKDLYGRTGIKKGYIGLFLEKNLSALYQKLYEATNEADAKSYGQQFGAALKAAEASAKVTFEETYYASPDIAVLSNGYVNENADLLLKKLQEPIREIRESFNPAALKNQPVLVIPSGGLIGLENSTFLKTSLEEYVKNGGTLVVFGQQRGYDFSVVPTPDGKPIAAYGWTEDQSCLWNGSYVDTYHQVLSAISTSTVSAGVDGYFSSYPDNSTILLRRSINSQPAMLMYQYGQGRVVVSSLYTDWGYAHSQATNDELAIVRDLLTWAKKPAHLPERAPGNVISVPITVTNSTSTDAAAIRMQVFNPDRNALIKTQDITMAVPAGQAGAAVAECELPFDASLGIYHVDYTLLDTSGNVIQPQAETDSGRFVVSTPPTNLRKNSDFSFAVNSDSEQYPRGSEGVFTINMYNNTDLERTITAKYFFPHHYWEGGDRQYGGDWASPSLNITNTITVPAKGSANFSHILKNASASFDRLWVHFYDENGNQIGESSRGFYVFNPSVTVSTQADKDVYRKGDTVKLTVNLQNGQNGQTALDRQVRVVDASNIAVYAGSIPIILTPNGSSAESLSFALPSTALEGTYTISVDVVDPYGSKIGGNSSSFQIPMSQISVVPSLPSLFIAGNNNISFALSNTGNGGISNGTLTTSLHGPDGVALSSLAQPFALAVGGRATLTAGLNIPLLTFGTYTLSYWQDDELRNGKHVVIPLSNAIATTVAFDKAAYSVRTTANASITLENTGKFSLVDLTVTVSAADAGYTDSRTINLGLGQRLSLQYAIPLPARLSGGQHDLVVTLTLPGGSSVASTFRYTVPQSSLVLSLDQSSYIAGGTIAPIIANTGGADTEVQYRASLYDVKSALIAEKSVTESVSAGGTLALSLPVPAAALDGSYFVVVTYTNIKTGEMKMFQKAVTVTGVKASLAVLTNKQAYLSTDTISATSTITNSGLSLQGGNLHLQVTTAGGTQLTKTWKSQFDFQQGIRKGVSTFETAGAVTLLPLSDNFDDGFINPDRWVQYTNAAGLPAVEASGFIDAKVPSAPTTWNFSGLMTAYTFPGDFDVSVDYSILQWGSQSHLALLAYIDGRELRWGVFGNQGYAYESMYGYAYWKYIVPAPNSGKLRIQRTGSTCYLYYWNGLSWTLFTSYGLLYSPPVKPATIAIWANSDTEGNAMDVHWDNFTSAAAYPSAGTINLSYDSGRSDSWGTLSFNADVPTGSSIKFRTRTSETQTGLSSAAWSGYLTTTGAAITSPKGRWIEVEATLSTTNSAVTPVLRDVTVTQGHNAGDILWQTDVPVNLTQGATAAPASTIPALGGAGKFYLQGTLTSPTGQVSATSESSFYVAQGNTPLTLGVDKKVYKPGDSVGVSGQVGNLASVTATNLTLSVLANDAAGTQTTVYTETFSVPAGGSHPFSATTAAGVEGAVALSATVTQSGTALAQAADHYSVSNPALAASASIPDVAGRDPFIATLQLINTGKIAASVTVQPSFDQSQSLTIPAGESRQLQFSRQIAADTMLSFVISGDLTQTISKTVKYGVAGTLALTPQAVYREGKVSVSAALTNPGLLDGQYAVSYRLTAAGNLANLQNLSYYLPAGGSLVETVSFDLTEGSYQLTATAPVPALSAVASFEVRKDVKADLALILERQTGGMLPATVSVSNQGYSAINGALRLSVLDGSGTVVWNASQDVSLPFAQTAAPVPLTFSINVSALPPGPYIVKAELLDPANLQLAGQTAPYTLVGAAFELTQVPPYQTVATGTGATMTFKVKNSGNQEGNFELSFKADDLINSTQTAWLKPGEEKEIPFTFTPASDVEAKDYSATYRLKSAGSILKEGAISYHLAGINLTVTALLDKESYNIGDTATLTLTIDNQSGAPSSALFARVNYNGYEEKRDFTLNGSQTLTFAVPLSQITGEKLFYGIYFQSGRSIHLNALYVYPASGLLQISSDKQVYNPGDTVTLSIKGTATGNLAMVVPGDPVAPFEFNSSATKSFTLPASMTAGTYTVAYSLTDAQGIARNGVTPFDVAGIQVKVPEALLDKVKYASTDTIRLSLSIESNRDLPVTIKTWVVDPVGSYTEAGSSETTLTAAAPVIATQTAVLLTASTGIHKLVYGIYQGDLILASGSKAFDIGNAILVGVSTDKTDYPDTVAAVTAEVDLYGTTEATVELFLDNASVKTDSVTLGGFGRYTFPIAPVGITAGHHTLKAVLTCGGLTSTKQAEFTFGSSLPDLNVRLAGGSVQGSSLMVAATVVNAGRAAASATRVDLYDSNPKQGAAPFASLSVPALEAGGSVDLPYAWSVLGKAGDHLIYAVVDPDNELAEFSEANNTAMAPLSVPKLGLAVSTAGTSFPANSAVGITVNYSNLSSSSSFQDLVLREELVDPLGAVTVVNEVPIVLLPPGTEATDRAFWNTALNQPGTYTLNSLLQGGGSTLLAGSTSFSIQPTMATTGNLTLNSSEVGQRSPLTVSVTVTNSGNVATAGGVRVVVTDPGTGEAKASAEESVSLPVGGSQSVQMTFVTDTLELKEYQVSLLYLTDQPYTLAGASFTVKDGAAPVLTVLSPESGHFYKSVAIAALATDDSSGVDRVEYQIDEGAWNPLLLTDAAQGRYETRWAPAVADNGLHTIRFRGYDRAGNLNVPAPVTFTADTVPPQLTVSTLSDGTYTNNDTLNIAGSVSEPIGLKDLQINGVAVPVRADGSFSYVVIMQNKDNPISVVATDLADNATIDSRTIHLDRTAPALTIGAPSDNSKTADPRVVVQGTVDESSTVVVKVKDQTMTSTMNGNDFTATVVLESGINTIEVTATDVAGNQSAQKRSVTYDDKTPSLSVTEPNQDIRTNRSSITIKGNASDPLTAVGITVTKDEEILTPVVINGVFEQIVNFSEEKLYTITVTATNEVGTQASVQRNLVYDVTPPTLTAGPVTSPTTKPTQVVKGMREADTQVNVTCATATVGAVTYPTANTWEVSITNIHPGENSITVTSSDAAGNVSTASVKIVYLEKAPDVSITATPRVLWPPDHKLVPVMLGGEVVPHGTGLQSLSISVADEYGKYVYTNLKYGTTIMLEAWRNGADIDGRVYTITAVATDNAGNTATQTTTVIVPHDQSR